MEMHHDNLYQLGSQNSVTNIDGATNDFYNILIDTSVQNDDVRYLQGGQVHTRLGFDGRNSIGEASQDYQQETNNNKITALPPVSTITGSLGHLTTAGVIGRAGIRLQSASSLLESSGLVVGGGGGGNSVANLNFWTSDELKSSSQEQQQQQQQQYGVGGNEVVDKYCWATTVVDADAFQQQPALGQNTDGSIYTLTVLENSEPSSMDGLDCRSPNSACVTDNWMRSNQLTDFESLFNMEDATAMSDHMSVAVSSVTTNNAGCNVVVITEQQQQHQQVVADVSNGEHYPSSTQATTFASTTHSNQSLVERESGENNNSWKQSDRNNAEEQQQSQTQTEQPQEQTQQQQQQQQSTESADESLLRNALQGKIYPSSVAAACGPQVLRFLAPVRAEPGAEIITNDLILSHLDLSSGVDCSAMESYCNLEPVCNSSDQQQRQQPQTSQLVYTYDPSNNDLGTITVAADLVSAIVVQTPPQAQDISTSTAMECQPIPEMEPNVSTNSNSSSNSSSNNSGKSKKPAKKYQRKPKPKGKANNVAAGAAGNNAADGANAGNPANTDSNGAAGVSSPGRAGGTGSRSVSPKGGRKERSLHYCHICSKGFKDKYSVNVHVRTHTGEKPFSCGTCSKCFRQKAHLAKHYQTHALQKNGSGRKQANSPSSTVTSSVVQQQQQQQQQQSQQQQQQQLQQVQTSDSVIYEATINAVASADTEILGS